MLTHADMCLTVLTDGFTCENTHCNWSFLRHTWGKKMFVNEGFRKLMFRTQAVGLSASQHKQMMQARQKAGSAFYISALLCSCYRMSDYKKGIIGVTGFCRVDVCFLMNIRHSWCSHCSWHKSNWCIGRLFLTDNIHATVCPHLVFIRLHASRGPSPTLDEHHTHIEATVLL